jgi:hypothetical protein
MGTLCLAMPAADRQGAQITRLGASGPCAYVGQFACWANHLPRLLPGPVLEDLPVSHEPFHLGETQRHMRQL